ncbi:MAG TPA: hypothetical protein VFL41_11920 [Gaiellaceae bacterium]|nr:hypothetical protein [Gaiellaceae bacterium]
MTEPALEPYRPQFAQQPVEPDEEIARRNTLLGWALFGVFLLLFAGTFAVGLVYLALD